MTTTPHTLIPHFDSLPSISLSTLQTQAAFLTRRDRKYLIPIHAADALLSEIDPATRVLEIDGQRSFDYLTPYFDDHTYSAYLSAARRRPNRFKVRTRLYIDSGLCLLEVKVRTPRGQTVKHRIPHDPSTLEHLSSPDRTWLHSFPQITPYAHHLHHCLTTRYHRTTLLLPNATGRVTLDRNLTISLPTGPTHSLAHYLIIETKGSGAPTPFDRLLWRHAYRPVSISKFASGLSLLLPHLPANRWHRLRTHLAASSSWINQGRQIVGTDLLGCPHSMTQTRLARATVSSPLHAD